MRKKAQDAADRNDHERASELYFRAAELYGDEGELYWQKYSESWGWSTRAKSLSGEGAEDFLKCAEYYDNSIRADNGALQHISDEETGHSVTEGNMRFTEGDRYTALANAEVERANKRSGRKKAEHLRRAAEFRLSGAQTMRLAAELSKGDGRMEGYYNRLGIYHRDRSGYHYYRGSAEREMDDALSALNEFEQALRERKTAMEMLKRSLKIRSDRSVKDNLKQDRAMAKTLKKDIARISKDAELARKRLEAAALAGTPKLNVEVRTVEGLVQNLVSTISVVLTNAGDGEARSVSIEIQSPFLQGEKRADAGSIAPGISTDVGLSVVPVKAGRPKARLTAAYLDARGRKYGIREMANLDVADPEESRPPPTTIYNVTGDYLAEGASKVDVRDSVIQRSNIGKDITVKKGLDEGEFRKAVDGLDEKEEARAARIEKGQKAIREDLRSLKRQLARDLQRLLREMPYPAEIRKERGMVLMEYRCGSCDRSIGEVKDRRWTRWMHMAVAGAMVGAGVATLRPEMGMKGVKRLYEDLSGKPLDDLPRERLFLTTEERDAMVARLRGQGILGELKHCPECGRWVCGECFDEDEGVCNEDLW